MSPTLQMPHGKLCADVIKTPIVRAVGHVVLKNFENDAWPRGSLRAVVHCEIARERSTVGIASGCGA